VRPDQSFNQLLPVTPGDQEHEAGCPLGVRTGTSRTRPPGYSCRGVVPVNQLSRVQPQVILAASPSGRWGLIELSHVCLAKYPDASSEGDPTNGVEHPEHSEVEGIPRRCRGVPPRPGPSGEGVAEVFLIRHQLGATGIQAPLTRIRTVVCIPNANAWCTRKSPDQSSRTESWCHC